MARTAARAARSRRDLSPSIPWASPVQDASPFRNVTRQDTPLVRDPRTSTSSKYRRRLAGCIVRSLLGALPPLPPPPPPLPEPPFPPSPPPIRCFGSLVAAI